MYVYKVIRANIAIIHKVQHVQCISSILCVSVANKPGTCSFCAEYKQCPQSILRIHTQNTHIPKLTECKFVMIMLTGANVVCAVAYHKIVYFDYKLGT